MERLQFYSEKILSFLALIRIPYLSLGGRTAFVNIFLIIDKELILIDTGPWREGYADGISLCLAKLGFSIKDVSKIIYTHPHPDHMGGGIELKREVAALYMIHGEARDHVEQYGEYVRFMKSQCKETFLRYLIHDPEKSECYSEVVEKFWHPTLTVS